MTILRDGDSSVRGIRQDYQQVLKVRIVLLAGERNWQGDLESAFKNNRGKMSAPVYMVGIIDVKDFQTCAEQYGMPVGAMFAEVGAEIIAASDQAEVL
jgi:hypothetical protein